MAELIQAATISKVSDKKGKFICFLVKSDRTQDYYQVTCLKIDGHCEFFCNCPARVECKHIKACKELCAARKELAKAAPVEQTPVVKTVPVASPAQVTQEAMEQVAVATTFPKAKSAAVKRAPQFTNRGFTLVPVPELGGRVVPLAS